MSWLSDLIHRNDPLTFEQDLELLIARWTDRSRKEDQTLTLREIGAKLLDRAEDILDGKG